MITETLSTARYDLFHPSFALKYSYHFISGTNNNWKLFKCFSFSEKVEDRSPRLRKSSKEHKLPQRRNWIDCSKKPHFYKGRVGGGRFEGHRGPWKCWRLVTSTRKKSQSFRKETEHRTEFWLTRVVKKYFDILRKRKSKIHWLLQRSTQANVG